MNSLAAFLTGPLAERFGWALLHFVWEGAAIAALLAVALRALRRRPAAARYRAGWFALVAMAGAIPLTAWFATPSPARSATEVGSSRVGRAERSPTTGAPASFGGPSLRSSRPTASPRATATADQSAAESRPAETGVSPAPLSLYLHAALPWVVGGWMIGAMLTALWHLGGWWQLRRLRRVGVREAPEEAQRLLAGLLQRFAVSRAVKLVVSVEVAVPTLLGWLWPLVILPAAVLAELPPRQLEMILAHELAHLRRCDYLWNLVQTAIETLLFYHPAVWWVARQIRAEREMCCDQQAVAALGDRLGYARALAALAELCRRPASLAPAGLALGASGGSFSTRIRRLLGQPVRDRVALPAWLGGGLAVLLLLAATVAGVTWAGDKATQPLPADGKAAAAAISRGEAFLEDGELDQALAAFTEAIRLSPQDAKAYYSRACVDKRNGELDKFSADLAEAIRLDPRAARAYFDRGWAYGRNRDLDKAIADFTERIRLHPDSGGAYSGRGFFCMFKGDLDKAVADFSEAIRLNPGDPFAYVNRGCAYGEKGDFDKAIADSTEAIRHYPGFAAPYSNRAWAYAGRGQLDKAVADAAEAIRLDAGDAEAYFTRGYAYAKKGQHDKAQADYATAVRLEAGRSHETELRGLAGFLFGRETEFIMLPAYLNLCNPEFRKELHVTPEQEKKLREISANRQAEDEKFARDLTKRLEKLPQDKRKAEIQRLGAQRIGELTIAGRKQIEKILTGQQLDAYKQHALAERVYQLMTMSPDAFNSVGVTPEQLAKLRRLAAEINRQSGERSRQQHEALVAVLSAGQREKLHAEVERVYRRRYEPADQGAGTSYFGSATLSVGAVTFDDTIQGGAATPATRADAADATLYLPIYDWLGQPAVRKQLGFSAAQQKQLAEIEKKYATDNANLVEKAGKIQQADFVKLYQALPKDVAGRIEALLTRPQWAALKEIMFRETASDVLTDSFVQEKIGLSRRQQAAVKDVFQAAEQGRARAEREACQQVLAILTPQQEQKLREEVERSEVPFIGAGQQPSIAAPPEGQGKPAAPAEPKPGKATEHVPPPDRGATITIAPSALRLSEAPASSPIETPDAPANQVVMDGGLLSVSSSASSVASPVRPFPCEEASETISLPAYCKLGWSAWIQRDVGLTEGQEARLREIAADFRAENQRIVIQAITNPPPGKTAKELSEGTQKKIEDLKSRGRKQIESVLGPRQLKVLQEALFRDMANFAIEGPGAAKLIGITAEQRKKMDEVFKAFGQQWRRDTEDLRRRTLAVLNPQQLKRLQPEVLQFYHNSREATAPKAGLPSLRLSPGPIGDWGTVNESYVAFSGADGSSTKSVMALPVYEEVQDPGVCKELGLSTAQQKRVQEINAKYGKEFAENRDRASDQDDFQGRHDQLAIRVRKQLETLLTPKQMTALADIVFRATLQFALADPKFQQQIGLSSQQKRDLERVRQDAEDRMYQLEKTRKEKTLGLLTPQQEQMLREQLDRSEATPSAPTPAQHPPAAPAKAKPGKTTEHAPAAEGKSAAAALARGEAFCKTGEFDKAIAAFSEAIRLDPKNATAYMHRGYAYARKDQRSEAGANYAAAARLEGTQIQGVVLCNTVEWAARTEIDLVGLPAYQGLCDPTRRDELKVTPEQERKLREVAARHVAEEEKFVRDMNQRLEKLPQKGRDAERFRLFVQRRAESNRIGRKQVEQVLTAQQVDRYERYEFFLAAYLMVVDPDALKAVGVTLEQLDKLWQLKEESDRQAKEELQQRQKELLATLSAPQREKLRAEVERVYRQKYEPAEETGGTTYVFTATFDPASSGTTTSSGTLSAEDAALYSGATIVDGSTLKFDAAMPVSSTDAVDAELSLPVYEWLGQADVRKQLGIGAAQQRQLAEIAKQYRADQEDLARKSQKVQPADFRRSDLALTKEVARQIESLLSRRQLAALKDIVFRETAADVLDDFSVQEKIGLTERQKAALKEISRAAIQRIRRGGAENYEKLLAILTPQQQEKLRAQLSREGAL